ncbi:DUF2061 domain-containing protein [Ideonella alba]|uniref:DUF2061 domain-containing protein n=1 Tax=Ideonella alba TaxID=2824118 RepID=A0A940YCB7_9BURK|nr:DUF2061 domain-containing protein [Ideonella alba]MBQ0932035.1 DUF2061 domain-containing protein [Ideonella alba]
MAKSAAFGIVHIATSFGVGYALTGSLALAGAITLVEPLVNTVAHYGFDKAWERWAVPRRDAAVSPTDASALPAH